MQTISGFFNWISERCARMQKNPPSRSGCLYYLVLKATTLPPVALGGKNAVSNNFFGKVCVQYASWIAY